MATFRVTFFTRAKATRLGERPVYAGRGATGLSELTTSGSAQTLQSGGSDWTAPEDGFVAMRTDGGAIWFSIGASPTAAVGTDYFMADAERLEVAVEEGDKISVIDDS